MCNTSVCALCDPMIFTVIAIVCSDLDMGSVVNVASITYSTGISDSRPFGTVASVTCDTGFGVVGSATSTCTGDGTSTMGVFNPSTFNCICECLFHFYWSPGLFFVCLFVCWLQ